MNQRGIKFATDYRLNISRLLQVHIYTAFKSSSFPNLDTCSLQLNYI
jgi:hypothetical protein